MTRRIICVDPDEDDRSKTASRLQTELSTEDIVIETAASRTEATELLDRDTAAVITEYSLPDGTGLGLIDGAREHAPDAGYVLYTDTDPDTIDTTELRGAITEYVGKESVFGTERLTELVENTITKGTQNSYPLPQDEDERIAALKSYDLDDPELVDSLDRVSSLAARHFEVERASINIINEHSQEFLACFGDAADWETMDREDSICTFTILEDDNVMVVEDVTEDPRFESRSETLIDMGIHSYLGANLVTPSGLTIGPLCIYDDQPRTFSTAEIEYLKDLASVAMDLIELHSHLDAAVTEGQP